MGVMDKFLNYMKLNGEDDEDYLDISSLLIQVLAMASHNIALTVPYFSALIFLTAPSLKLIPAI